MKQLENSLISMGLNLDQDMKEKFLAYMKGILLWNEKINLTAITDEKEFIQKHFIDSILCIPFDEYKNAKNIIDVGTGAGFPGIPLAIASDDKHFILADSLQKRLRVIDTLADEIGISNIETVHGRAEELGKNKAYRERFDLCVSRAVANLTVLAEYCLPFVKIGGFFLAYKGPDAEKEIEDAAKAIKILGGRIDRIACVALSGYEHKIAVIQKVNRTPAKYPRKAGTPSKEPIR
ncbi:16S rRNA (guanine(527)-N(7))-methyltransferase RsmG [Ihubacter sp. rT4E-8]|uniref:16S rRNA (guanine(527)-N(7))-methyltransferase RsmG n=1 Tax=Ihubacter sp. rT4E-8 TaxID=3242369 RepID=UPI003CF9FAE4